MDRETRNLAGLPAEALRLLAEFVAALAEEAAERERRRAEIAAAHATKRHALDHLAEMVTAHMAAGMSYDGAVRAVARETEFSIETVVANVEHRARCAARQGREARRALMLRLARRGWTNGEIAAHLGCHPSTVTREIRRVFRPAAPPAVKPREYGQAVLVAMR